MHYKKDGNRTPLAIVEEWLEKKQGQGDKIIYGNRYRTWKNYGEAKAKTNKKEYDRWYYENVRKNKIKPIDRDKGNQPGNSPAGKNKFRGYLKDVQG